MRPLYGLLPVIAAWLASGPALADAPTNQTRAPTIYLADNLDEKDNLGWCIDTLGRGFSEDLQTHSCKPAGDDVLFTFTEATGRIASATYANKCAVLEAPPAAGVTLGLVDCADTPAQRFAYDAGAKTFKPAGREDLCLAAGAKSNAAGPFMARTLALANCASTSASLIQWIVKEGA